MSKSKDHVTGGVLTLILLLIACGLTGCVPIPAVPPGCHVLCRQLGGVYLKCIDECPSIKRCKEGAALTDLTEVYMDNGPIQAPRLCERHCWPANMYTERQCMRDCPLTWCRKYGKIPQPTTSTIMRTTTKPTTTLASAATTMPLTLGTAPPWRTPGPNVQPIEEQPDKYSIKGIVLGTLAFIAFIAVLVAVIGLAYCRYSKSRRPAQKEQGEDEEKVPMDPFSGPVPPTGDDKQVNILLSPSMGQQSPSLYMHGKITTSFA